MTNPTSSINGWVALALGATALPGHENFVDGDWIEAPFITSKGIRFIQTGNIGIGFFIDKADQRKYISENSFRRLRCRWVHPGDLLICRLAAPIGRCCEVSVDVGECVTSVDCTIFRPDPKTLNKRYAVHLLNSEEHLHRIDVVAAGSTRQRISRTHLGRIRVEVPANADEQKDIAHVLDAADGAIVKTETLIAKLKAIKQGLLHDLLTRGLDGNGELRNPEKHPEQFKETPVGRIPNEWDVRPLYELADVDRGKFMHRPRNDPRFYGGSHPFVQTGDVAAAEGGVLYSFSQTLNEKGAAVSLEFPKGTIGITIAANIADTAILGCPMFFPDSIVGAVVKPPNVIRYVELQIRNHKSWLSAQAPQSAQKNINLETLRPLLVSVPEPDEQSEIADRYETLDSRISSETAYLMKLKAIKKGLMQDLLTGRVRLGGQEGKA